MHSNTSSISRQALSGSGQTWRGQVDTGGRPVCGQDPREFARLHCAGRTLLYAPIAHWAQAARLPVSLRVLLESLTRQALLGADVAGQIEALLDRLAGARLGFLPARVLLDDLAGVPLLLDLVSLRDAVAAAGGDTAAVNPRIPVDLLLGADSPAAGGVGARGERGELLAWCRRNFDELRMLPSGGRDAQWINLECLTEVVRTESAAGGVLAYPDTLVGTHARTAAANALGVLGWSVSGLEATAALLGEPLSLTVPQVVGVELRGRPPAQAGAGDLALRISEQLRLHPVADKLVEFFGRGVETLSVPARAMVASMAPETGARCLYFPVDRRALDYMLATGREPDRVRLLEQYVRIQSLHPDVGARPPDYDTVVSLDLGEMGGPAARARGARLETKVAQLAPARAGRSNLRDYAARRAQTGRGAAGGPASRFPWPRSGGWISRATSFDGLPLSMPHLPDVLAARPLVIAGDAVSVEDISPSGAITADSAAGEYLLARGASPDELDTYEMRRGDCEVAVRATFAGARLKNRLAGGAKGGVTALMPERIPTRVFDAASEYQHRNVPLVVIAGRRYGCGCVHDWAAKGVALLGVSAVIAESFERIHRTSLIGAGVLPLVFERLRLPALALDGSELFDLLDLDWTVGVRTEVRCLIRRSGGDPTRVLLRTAIETADELYYLRSGGILPALWRERLRCSRAAAPEPHGF